MAKRTHFFIIFAVVAGSLLGQVKGPRVEPPDATQRPGFETRRRAGVAILVGVGKYPRYSGLSGLHYPDRDVDLLEKELTAQRYSVVTLKDTEATRGAVLNAIRQAGEVLDPASGVMVFFFSGHGYAEGTTNYLATYDAASNSLAQSGLAIPAVEKALIDAGATRRVLWIDACRNEPGKGAGEGRSFTRFDTAAGTRILFSTKAGRVSYEDDELQQGIFSYFLVKGLHGEAAGVDGLVSFRDLADYVTDSVETRSLKEGRVQVPYEAGESRGDFLLAKLSGALAPVVPPVPQPVSRGPQVGDVRVNPKDGQRYVWVPPGSFMMGCSNGDNECYQNEKPAHPVTITKGFWVGQTPVTVGEYRQYSQRTGKPMPGDHDDFGLKVNAAAGNDTVPVVLVTWDGSQAFCEWSGGRLPTEAEWEYAARAGFQNARYGNLDDIAWYADNSGRQRIDSTAIWRTDQANYVKRLVDNGNGPHPVGQKQPNNWKLYDMLSNVLEWSADWYGERYYQQQESRDPQGPPGGEERTARGGSWAAQPRDARATTRFIFKPSDRKSGVGFRCVQE